MEDQFNITATQALHQVQRQHALRKRIVNEIELEINTCLRIKDNDTREMVLFYARKAAIRAMDMLAENT